MVSSQLFFLSAARIPKISPTTAPKETASSPIPKLTGTRFFNRTEMEVSLEITYDTPKSPCSRFFTYVKNCTINGLSSPYFFDIIAIWSAVSFSSLNGDPGISCSSIKSTRMMIRSVTREIMIRFPIYFFMSVLPSFLYNTSLSFSYSPDILSTPKYKIRQTVLSLYSCIHTRICVMPRLHHA